MKSFVKRVSEAIVESFDMAEFVAAQGGDVDFTVRADAGITVQAVKSVANVITLTVTGGLAGRLYRFGFDAVGPTGETKVVNNLLRVRDITRWDEVPEVGAIGSPERIYLLSAVDGVLLLSANGEALYVE